MTARLVVKAGETNAPSYALEPDRSYVIGRSREADIIVKGQLASRRHCKLELTPNGEWAVTDQNSSNGTFVNRQRVTSRPLRDGDVLQVGKATLEFRVEDADETASYAAQETPEPASAQPPSEGPKPQETSDEDLQDLFRFLEGIDSGTSQAEEGSADGSSQQPPPAEGSAAPGERGALFSLADDEADRQEGEETPRPAPGAERQKKEGGLLAFLRKKKQS